MSPHSPAPDADGPSSALPILLIGATGYVGGRLLGRLEKAGLAVRCLARRPEALVDRVGDGTRIVAGDLLEAESLAAALDGVHTAFYLAHSMGSSGDFEEKDREAARNFVLAADRAGVRRIVYLGGLGDSGEPLSRHLRSRQETGEILRSGRAQVIEFRASIVIGSGSLSFEMIRALVERLPIMICPRWVQVLAQPIAIDDVLEYLMASLDIQAGPSAVFEIGGPDQVSYREIMREYAQQRGLRRAMIPVPLLTPRLSSLWLGLVTPIYARVGKKLVESLRHPTVVTDRSALEVFAVKPRSIDQAIARALLSEDREFAESSWFDAMSSGGDAPAWGGRRLGSRLIDSRSVRVDAPPAEAFRSIQRIGGGTGWYHADLLWRVRAFLDLLVGGVGMRRGRRDPEHLRVGDALDFWRVEAIEPGRRLRLQAEMKVPGRAWLEFEVTPDGSGAILRQTASFDPLGLLGLAYWYAIYPLHGYVFAGMLKGIAKAGKGGAARGGAS